VCEKEEVIKDEESEASQQRPEGNAMTTNPTNQVSLLAWIKGPLALAFTLALTILAFAAACAQAANPSPAPGWEVTSATFPTHMGQPVNEVQELTVSATAGTFTLFFEGSSTAPIGFAATDGEVAGALEALPAVGPGNVTVTGGRGDATGTKPYVIAFTGALAGRTTGQMFPNSEQLELNGGGLESGSAFTTVKTKGLLSGAIEINVYNTGAQPSTGTVTVTDVLPAGVVATEAGDVQTGIVENIGQEGLWECTGNAPGETSYAVGKGKFVKPASVVTCVNSPSLPALPIPEVYGSGNEVGSGTIAHIGIGIDTGSASVPHEEGTFMGQVTVAGGGASSPASTSTAIAIGSAPPSFGFQNLDGWFSNADGTTDTQAGSHPYGFTFSLNLNTVRVFRGGVYLGLAPAGGEGRDLAVDLPPGFIGNPTVIPQCTRQQFDFEECPPSTQVGIDQAGVLFPDQLLPVRAPFPVYNLVPPPGVPAEFAFDVYGVQTFLDANVRSGGDYGLVVHINNIGDLHLMYNNITFWGEPSDPLHNGSRFSKFGDVEKGGPACTSGCPSSAPRIPFLTLPTSCEGPQTYSASLNTWETGALGETSFLSHDSSNTPVGFTGCGHLDFKPSISTAPDTASADTPAGLTVDVRAPQEGLATTGALTTSDIKDTTVTLPAGVVINPGQAAGLQACQYSESGLGVEPTPAEPSKGEPSCPNASKVGTDEAVTPILFHPLKGNVYVLNSNPPHLKLLAALSGEGVIVKLVLEVELNEQTGQITTHVLNIPQAPVSDFTISFSGGAQAALATPTQCGSYTATSDFTPWSAPSVGDVFPSSNFAISSGPGGGACPSSTLPFGPSLTAGSTTDQAGGFTSFSLLLQRGDGQQRIEKLQFKAPQGLSGMLSRVPLCGEPQAQAGTCSAASQIGHASVAAGPGPYPLTIPQPGNPESPIYLTGPYEGAPFGLTIVTHVLAGPFNLGNVITRARVEVDRHTAQITVTTDPLPQVIDGVPTDLRLVDSVIDRPGFMFNPTNCSPSSFSGTATGTPPPGAGGAGASAPISSHFQVGSCQSLKFAPSFKVSTSGKTSRSKGASLDAKVIYPAVPLAANQAAGEANIASVKVDLPKQLPSRLTTLQKACTAAQFEANPAGCPSASVIGHATAITQVLPVPLTGPAIFVSHGGEAFPSLIIVLQGYGVRVDLIASTFISHAGITSSTFKTLPDVPFKSFDLNLPEGKYSALAANGNLCTSKLKMPTAFTGQNGAKINQSTPIIATGCAKTKAMTRTQKLTAALRACHKKAKGKQAACVKTARKRYGPLKKKRSKSSG
jgi:hypothetical protein